MRFHIVADVRLSGVLTKKERQHMETFRIGKETLHGAELRDRGYTHAVANEAVVNGGYWAWWEGSKTAFLLMPE